MTCGHLIVKQIQPMQTKPAAQHLSQPFSTKQEKKAHSRFQTCKKAGCNIISIPCEIQRHLLGRARACGIQIVKPVGSATPA